MKSFFFAATMLALAAPSLASDVGVSIHVGQPGFYGRIDIGQYPQPSVIYSEPLIIQHSERYVGRPIYLRVPPGHMKKWSKHCGRYNACGQQVYFVQDDWYQNVYAPRYRTEHEGRRNYRDDGERRDRNDQGKHGGNGKHKNKGHDRD